MARLARVVVPGLPHHVTQRGNRRANVFFEDADRLAYLANVRHYARLHGLEIWAYCLMTNHIHFVVVPVQGKSMSLAFHDAHTCYAGAINARRRLSGHLWQARFFSTALDESHLWAAVRYVERNPVRAGMVARAEEYRWSSARAHCGVCTDSVLSASFPPAGAVEDWPQWLHDEDAAQTKTIRCRTQTGRPCGAAAFVADIERRLGRVLQPQKPGPKRQVDDATTLPLFG